MKNIRFKTKKHKAFTILELLTVIAMISILTAIALTNLTGTKTNAKLRAAQREIAATIKQAQSFALQGKTVSGYAGSVTSYGVCFETNQTYKLIYNDNCNNFLETVTLSGVTYAMSGGATDGQKINFDIPKGIMNPNPAFSVWPLSITLTPVSGSGSASVFIGSGGVVTEN